MTEPGKTCENCEYELACMVNIECDPDNPTEWQPKPMVVEVERGTKKECVFWSDIEGKCRIDDRWCPGYIGPDECVVLAGPVLVQLKGKEDA